MKHKQTSVRTIKKNISKVLESSSDHRELLELTQKSLLKLINALFSFLYHKNPVIKWNTVIAMGAAVSELADQDMESARNIIRRLMWNLNDESGGIGWGSVEAMGEILAVNAALAREYASVLLSYGREDGNYQEHELMQRGVLWGIGRLYEARPEITGKEAAEHIIPYIKSNDATVRGLAARVLGILEYDKSRSELELLTGDETPVQLFLKNRQITSTVKEQAEKALERIKNRKHIIPLEGSEE
ncbi:DVU0298 family protein [Thermodesulfobacteriota bacterium]